MSAALLELAARVEGLAGPDRDIDTEILWHVNRALFSNGYWNAASGLPRPLETMPGKGGLGWIGAQCSARTFTGSIDAAMSLVPRGCGFDLDRYWVLDREGPVWRCDLSFGGTPNNPRRVHVGEDAHSAATAITAAALRAKAAGEGV